MNTAIVVAVGEGIVQARDPSQLKSHGGHLIISKDWAKSPMSHVGFVKRKASNAGKVAVHQFNELKEEYIADITAEVVLNEIPHDLVINWDQTPLKYVPTGDWTMNLAGEKVIPVVGTDDKRQITAVLTVTLTGEYLPPQITHQGTTNRCHPIENFPAEWDI